MNLFLLANEIIDGKRISYDNTELNEFITCDIEELKKSADKIREAFIGTKVDLCTIINGKSGKCGENCKFCAQSAHNHTNCEIYDLLDEDEIISKAKSDESEGVNRFAIVNSGHNPSDSDFEKIIHCFERMNKECKIGLCASLGFLTSEQFHKLKTAGVTRIHNNIETSRRFFPYICTTHTFDDKINNIKKSKSRRTFCMLRWNNRTWRNMGRQN